MIIESLHRYSASSSMAEAFAYLNDPDTTETQTFVHTFDQFMNCFNTHSFDHFRPQLIEISIGP